MAPPPPFIRYIRIAGTAALLTTIAFHAHWSIVVALAMIFVHAEICGYVLRAQQAKIYLLEARK